LNDRSFELGEYAHHLKHCLACRGPGVKALLVQEQVNTQRMQL